MTKAGLVQQLNQLNIDPRSYCLDHYLPDEQYVLAQWRDNLWCVYYAERGQRSGLREFNSENEACVFFLETLNNDPTTRLQQPK